MNEIECPYMRKGSVQCFEKNCEHCGWNPKVEKQRKAKILSHVEEKDIRFVYLSYGKWLSPTEKKPFDNQRVIMYGLKGGIEIAKYIESEDAYQREKSSNKVKKIAFWMPLPEPPKGTEGTE